MRRFAISFFASALVPVTAAAFQNGPSFHSSTRLVQINVVVRDRNGPVANLSKDDFSVTDDGKLRNVQVFSISSATSAPQTASALPPATFSNAANSGVVAKSVTVVLLDALNTLSAGSEPYEETPTWVDDHALANAKQHLVQFVAQMEPN